MKERLEEIIKRLQEITVELEDENTDETKTKELEEESKSLIEEQKSLMASVEKRKQTLEKVKRGMVGTEVESEERKDNNMDAKKVYRSAFFKKLQGKELTEEEKRALTTEDTSAGAVVPEETSKENIKKITTIAPVLNDITLLKTKGNVKFAVEGVKTEANKHGENASINSDNDTLVEVSLAGYEVTKKIQISDSVKTMSIDSFETWLEDMIAEMVAKKLSNLIFNGTGNGEAKGITKIAYNASNQAKATTITSDLIRKAVGLLPSGYDAGAKMYMNKKFLFNELLPLQDNAKNELVRIVDGKYYVYSYEVSLDDSIVDTEAYLGNMKKYVANLAEDVNVKSAYDIDTNSYKYLGVAIFDGKPAIEEAFVQIKKGA